MRKVLVLGCTVAAAMATLASSSPARAGDALPTRADHVATPGKSAASEDGGDAIVLNPGNLGWMPAPEARWTGVGCSDAPRHVACGHAFELATPLFFGLGTGLRVDFVQTPWTLGFPYNGMDYTWVTWGLGYALGDAVSIGTSLERSYSPNSYIDGLFGVTASLSVRANTHLGLSVVAHELNAPAATKLPPTGLPILDPNYTFSAALRPTGRRDLELALDLRYLEGSDQFVPRTSLQVDIPGVGRARGDLEVAHLPNDQRRGVQATAGLEIDWGRLSVGGGVLLGSGLGKASAFGEYGTVALHGWEEPTHLPKPQKAVYIRPESTPSARTHMELLQKLWAIADDPSIAALTFVVRTEPASSFAHAEELADAFRVIRARGKKILCSFEDNGSKALYVCANADRIVLNPAGGIRYAGLKTQYMYFKNLLDKIGVKADVLRISEHKSAPEQFTNDHASDTARSDHEDLLHEYEAVFTKNLASGRHLSEARVREATRNGPFVASEARDAGFVDGFAFDDELERATSELVGHRVRLHKYDVPDVAPPQFGPRDKVGVLLVEGDMIDGRSEHIPLVDMRLVGSYSVAENARQLADDPTVKSVVLRIESPGGSSMAADVMWRALAKLAEKKPLIVSMGSVAASGGYYIAMAGREVYALPLTVTGSIGIFYGKADVSELLSKIGVSIETYKTAPRADAESFYRPFTDDERKALDVKIHQFYDVFLDRVSRGRHMTKAQVDAVAEGRVWSGQEALDRHLVDKMGGLREALARAREAGGLAYDAPILELPPPETSLLEKAIGLVVPSISSVTLAALPVQVKDLARALAPMMVFKGDVPMARLEFISLDGDL